MKVRNILLTLLILVLCINIYAAGQGEGKNTTGEGVGMMMEGEGQGGMMQGKGKKIKRIVNNGERKSFSGTIIPDDEDWILITDDSKEYKLYMPPDFYLENINLSLEEGMTVKIEGYLYLKEIVPNVFLANEITYKFWDDFGVPPWAGTQMGKNKKGDGDI